jgi:ribonuclease BN (tRNA processing enzyme)
MCDAVGELLRLGVSRRRFIQGATAAGGMAAFPAIAAAADPQANTTRRPMTAVEVARNFTSRLVLLGTSGGPTWQPDRQGIASAVIVNGRIYLVDCGEGVGRQLMLALRESARQRNLQPPTQTTILDKLQAIFLTHLHSDHTIDYFNLFLYGWYTGLTEVQQPVQVFGPGNRGQMEPLFNARGEAPAVMNPENPTPGTVEMTGYLYQAFATDENDRMRDNNRPDLRELVKVNDIQLPRIDGFKSPNSSPSPPMDPFVVWKDDHVSVSATLVHHAPIFPAFAFRFDTEEGSVVFSGDTSPSENLIRMARGADVLVHEVIDMDFFYNLFPKPWNEREESLLHHLQAAHTTIDDVGGVAESAGVKTLVLTHIVPGNTPVHKLLKAQKGFSGELIIGEDLMQIGIGRPRRRQQA